MSRVVRVANAIIITATLLVCAFCVFLLYRHGWSASYLGLMLLGLVFLPARWLPSTAKILCSLLLVGITASLYGAETLLHVLPPAQMTWEEMQDQTHGLPGRVTKLTTVPNGQGRQGSRSMNGIACK